MICQLRHSPDVTKRYEEKLPIQIFLKLQDTEQSEGFHISNISSMLQTFISYKF